MIDLQEMINEHNKRAEKIINNPVIESIKTLQNMPSLHRQKS